MFKKLLIIYLAGLFLSFGSSGSVYAGDVSVELDSADGSSSFTVKDSSNAVVYDVASNGNVGIGEAASNAKLKIVSTDNAFKVSSSNVSSLSTEQAPWFENPKNCVSLFLGKGSSEDTSGYLQDDYSGNIRFGGYGSGWGDFSYYPTGGDNGEYGNFRLSRSSTAVETVPDAKLGVGSLYSAGSIGIGTATPLAELDVTSTTERASLVLNRNEEVVDGWSGEINFKAKNNDIARVGAASAGATEDTGQLIFETWNAGVRAEAMRILQNGNLGIGNTNPATKLYVNGASTVTGQAAFGMDITPTYQFAIDGTHIGVSASQDYQRGVYIGVNPANSAEWTNESKHVNGVNVNILGDADFDATSSIMDAVAGNFQYGLYSTAAGHIDTVYGVMLAPYAEAGTIGSLYDLFIRSTQGGGTITGEHFSLYQEDSVALNYFAGNVGIGVREPNRKLAVNGDVFLASGTGNYGNGRLHVVSSGDLIGCTLDSSSRQWDLISIVSSTPDHFGIRDITADATRLAIDENGNVGIGSTAPGAKLEVRRDSASPGDANAAVSIRASGSADKLDFGVDSANRKGWIQALRSGISGNDLLLNPTQGNVGIGTTTPAAVLDVDGDARISGDIIHEPGTITDFTLKNKGLDKDIVFTINDGGTEKEVLRLDGSANQVNVGNGTEAMVIDANGNVGIGTATPGYTLEVNGTAACTSGTWSSSDSRLKKNVEPIGNALDIVSELEGVTYDWRTDEFPEKRLSDGKQIGMIAQEVEKVIPELVHTGTDGFKTLAYDRFTAYLIEAVKELKSENESLRERIEKLENAQ